MDLDLVRCELAEQKGNVVVFGQSSSSKTDVTARLGMAALQKVMSVSFLTAAFFMYELMEVKDEGCLLRLQRQLAAVKFLIIDELGYVPLSRPGAALVSELISQRCV